jgi:hypothetical protein
MLLLLASTMPAGGMNDQRRMDMFFECGGSENAG